MTIYRTADKAIKADNWEDFYREVWEKYGVPDNAVDVEWQEINGIGWEVCRSTLTISR